MEMSWYALGPTIVIAVFIALAVLLRRGERARLTATRRAQRSAAAAALPSVYTALRNTGKWARHARKPVWPMDYKELNVRLRRGLKIAAVMVGLSLMFVGDAWGSSGFALVEILLMALPFTAIGAITSVVHSFVLQLLPWRGVIVSTALGWGIGMATAYVLRDSEISRTGLIWTAAIYGFMVGLIDLLWHLSKPAQVNEQPST